MALNDGSVCTLFFNFLARVQIRMRADGKSRISLVFLVMR